MTLLFDEYYGGQWADRACWDEIRKLRSENTQLRDQLAAITEAGLVLAEALAPYLPAEVKARLTPPS